MRFEAFLVVGLLLFGAGSAVGKGSGIPVLEAQALLVDGETGPEVRVEFQLRNGGSATLRGCVGRMWGWKFPRSDDLGARTGVRVMTPRPGIEYALRAGQVRRWNEKLSYEGPKAWIEAVVFEIDLLPADCEGKRVARLESNPVLLTDATGTPPAAED